ncbi:sensor histidine kinase [Caulobacter sp. B11]|uniref:sensor histidine kinase n=1 Tax=Caulobacter sp. B11 TaxID=2048899 RepID=UPI003513E45C
MAVAAPAGRRDPDRLRRRHRHPPAADRSAALAEAERLKRDFVGNVSYELRTPLTTIIGYSELLERADGLTERGKGHVAAVRSAATQLARSIDDVLDMAQIDAGEMALEIEDIRVEDLLTHAQTRFERLAEVGGVTLTLVCDEAVGLIRGDRKRLSRPWTTWSRTPCARPRPRAG